MFYIVSRFIRKLFLFEVQRREARKSLILLCTTVTTLSYQSTLARIIFHCSIYKGWLPTVLKVSTAQATRFGVFQVLKSSPYYGKDNPIKSALAGATAGATSVVLFQVHFQMGLSDLKRHTTPSPIDD